MVSQISVLDLKAMREKGALTLVDIRDEASFEAGHIEGALRIGNENIQAFLGRSDREGAIVCYCYHGVSSLGVAQYFMDCGFKKVYSLSGGFEAWEQSLTA